MASPSQPTVPVEIVNHIIDKIVELPNDLERRRGLAATALLAHHFCCSSHKHLFASVTFCLKLGELYCIPGRVTALRDLIYTEPHSETIGIVSYIRSFQVRIDQGLQWIGATVTLFNDDTLPAILRMLFRIGQGRLSFTNNGGPMYWGRVCREFKIAFHDLARSSQITTLQLRLFVGLPLDILHGTNIKHIEVSCLFDLCNSATAAFTQEPIQLESISTDHVTPILYLLKSPNHRRSPQWIFARLTKLTMTILNDDAVTKMMSIISCAPVLDTLAVESFCGISTSRPLTWTQMATFRHLRIFDKGLTPQSFEPKGGQCAATRVLDVAEDPPQTLKTLSLEFALKFMIHPRYGCPTKLQHHDYAPIDEVLARTANTRYRNVEQLYICGIGQLGPIPGGFDLVTFKTQACRELVARFPFSTRTAS